MHQLKLLAMLLVIVNGQPLGKLLPSMMLLCLLCFEHLYQQVLQPLRTHQLRHVQTATVALLIASVTACLILQDCEKEASQAGLAAVAVLMGIANCVFKAYLFIHLIASTFSRQDCSCFVTYLIQEQGSNTHIHTHTHTHTKEML